MRNHNHKRIVLRWQDACAAALALLLLLLATFDPESMWMSRQVRYLIVAVGAVLGAGVVLRMMLRTAFCGAQNGGQPRKALLVAMVAVHLVATLIFLPPGDLLNDKPIVTLDHSFHHYQAARANQHLFRTGRLDFYDPYFMAGYPSAIFDLDMKATELFCAFFPAGQVARALKVFILLCYLTLVLSVYLGMRYLGYSERESLLGLMVALVVWHWGRPYLSHFRYAGMFNYLLMSHGALLVAGLFQRFWNKGSGVALFVLGALLFFVHPTAVVVLPVPVCLVLICGRRRFTPRRVWLLLLWWMVVVAVNLVWIVPMFQHLGDKMASSAYFQVRGLDASLDLLFHPSSLPAGVMLLLAIIGTIALSRVGRVAAAAVPVVTAIFLLLVTAYGLYIPGLRQLEPGRFLVPALIFLVPPAGAGLASVLGAVHRAVGERGVLRWSVPVVLAVTLVSPVVLSLLSARTTYHHRVSTSVTPEVQRLIDVLREHTNSGGRLMIEDGPARLYGGVHLPGILPLYTGVEQIGGPYPFTVIRHHFATFEKERTMGRALERHEARAFKRYFDLYNILWIVTATPEAADFVRRTAGTGPDAGAADTPLVDRTWQSGRYTLWRVNRKAAYTDVDGPEVTAGIDRIEIAGTGAAPSFVLKYHWDKRLSVTPPATMTAEFRMDDPVPFIRITPNGADRVVIRY
ncbi:MAG: hypothetical protein V3V49_02415 [Candidatus Krumholzibacteria bacterium]